MHTVPTFEQVISKFSLPNSFVQDGTCRPYCQIFKDGKLLMSTASVPADVRYACGNSESSTHLRLWLLKIRFACQLVQY